jgi:hypothetical protein
MKPRRTSLTARMSGLLDRMAFALDVLPVLIPDERRYLQDKHSPRGAFQPSTARLSDEARALIAEYRQRERMAS